MQGIFNGNARRLLLIVAHLLEKGNMIYLFFLFYGDTNQGWALFALTSSA